MPPPSQATLGTRGPSITRLGFGAWALGGGWGPQDDNDSIAAIHHALDLGIDWIDTAAIYGAGHSEEVVARALDGIVDRPLVATKCGLEFHDGPGDRTNLRPDHIRRECEASLRRLRVDTIDLYQFHWPDIMTGTPVEESWGVMADLVAHGKVRFAGVSNFDVPLMERCEPILHIDSLQPPFSAISRGVAAEILPWCHANGTGVIVYSPMGSGLLTGRFSHERMAALAPGDWRHTYEQFQEPALSRNMALQDALRPIAKRHNTGVASIAVAWTLAWPGVTSAIVGARSPHQVDDWIGASGIVLDGADLDEIAAAISACTAGTGPLRPKVS